MKEPIDYYMEHELEQERQYQRWCATRTRCCWCNEPIAEEFAFKFGDDWVCEDCVDDYIQENCREKVPDNFF